jgi:hypothetical protein
MKTCNTCGVKKPLDAFYRAAGMRDGHRGDCIECNLTAKRARQASNPEPYRERARQWAKDNPERRAAYQAEYRNRPEVKRAMRNLYYRRTYGITADEADQILAAQNGRCAICSRPAPDRLASMHLDHDHETGRIRGFLCLDCNQGLGKMRDSPDLLLRALVYLRQHSQPVDA